MFAISLQLNLKGKTTCIVLYKIKTFEITVTYKKFMIAKDPS